MHQRTLFEKEMHTTSLVVWKHEHRIEMHKAHTHTSSGGMIRKLTLWHFASFTMRSNRRSTTVRYPAFSFPHSTKWSG